MYPLHCSKKDLNSIKVWETYLQARTLYRNLPSLDAKDLEWAALFLWVTLRQQGDYVILVHFCQVRGTYLRSESTTHRLGCPSCKKCDCGVQPPCTRRAHATPQTSWIHQGEQKFKYFALLSVYVLFETCLNLASFASNLEEVLSWCVLYS